MAGFFDEQDQNDKKEYKKMVVYFLAAASLVMLLFLVVIYMNTSEKQAKKAALAREQQAEFEAAQDILEDKIAEDSALAVGESNLTSKDLDFWDMYETDKDPFAEDEDTVSSNENKDDIISKRDKLLEKLKNQEVSDNSADDQVDNLHIRAVDGDGVESFYEILDELEKHTYDFKANSSLSDNRLSYNDKKTKAVLGVDVSKYQGTIDWSQVKGDGYDFAMIRLGTRGYSTGNLMLDENFIVNITGAKNAGLKAGVYFYSQATSVEEAVEEANFTVGALMNYGVTYPVVCDIEWVENDSSRTDSVSVEDRTQFVKAYCDTVQSFGYNPMIYATRDMLIAGLDMTKLDAYEVWLQDDYEDNDGTDYPYQFTMWQYTQKGSVKGISGLVDIDACFVDYSER